MYKRWLIWIILSVLALSNLGAARQDSLNYGPSGTIRGYVYLDSNRNGKFDDGEKGLPGVYVTISFGEYYHTYYTGDGDPDGDVPGPGSYGPTDLPGGSWTVTLHVPDGYRATSAKTITVDVPDGGAATGADFGIYGSGKIRYANPPGGAMGGGAGSTLPYTGAARQVPLLHWVALLAALAGLLTLLVAPWYVSRQARS
jgi:hypothetical protein